MMERLVSFLKRLIPTNLLQAMLKLAHDEELRARMSANAIARSDDFSIDKAVKEWDRLFERVVAKEEEVT